MHYVTLTKKCTEAKVTFLVFCATFAQPIVLTNLFFSIFLTLQLLFSLRNCHIGEQHKMNWCEDDDDDDDIHIL